MKHDRYKFAPRYCMTTRKIKYKLLYDIYLKYIFLVDYKHLSFDYNN